MKVKISAVIITCNEQQNMKRCLESLQGVADDSYSTGRKVEICRSHYDQGKKRTVMAR